MCVSNAQMETEKREPHLQRTAGDVKGTSEMDLTTLGKQSWYLHGTLQRYADT